MNDEKFNVRYSAPTERERKEIESIKNQYIETKNLTDDKIEKLKNLHKKVKTFPTAFALSLGILGTLLFGLGMAMILEWGEFFYGTTIAVLGLIPILLSYSLYNFFLNKNKKKYGQEIVNLSNEILNEQD